MSEQHSNSQYIAGLLKLYPQFASEDSTTVRITTEVIMSVARQAYATGIQEGVALATDKFNTTLKGIVPDSPAVPQANQATVEEIAASLASITPTITR